MSRLIWKYLIFAFLLLGVQHLMFAQDAKYWIEFADKQTENYDYRTNLSPQAIENRKLLHISLSQYSDIPVSNEYLKQIETENIIPITKSKWLNAVSADLTESQIEWLRKQDFVQKIVLIDRYFKTMQVIPESIGEINYSTAISQMEPGAFEVDKLTGKGITIGVIDAGFYGSHKRKSLSRLMADGNVLAKKDFVHGDDERLFDKSFTNADSHGTRVLEMIAGKRLSNSKQFGFATEASFYLARTDDGNNEFRGEEDYWIAAMEWMDSLGTRIINTSLGYALGFDNPDENYLPSDMDGKTTMISKAAQIATNEKGILLVVSAGNEGLDPEWRIVSAPADAEGVISVGATTHSGNRASYSSIGPTSLSYLKPNISCYSSDGTSFSAPVITGFAACLMQKKPTATNREIKQIIEQSGHLYPYGNNFIGQGIPKSTKAINLINEKQVKSTIKLIKAKSNEFILLKVPMETVDNLALVFHKKNEFHVWREQTARIFNGKIKLKRPKSAVRSTVIIDGEVGYEVVWE
jgi:hypothetical protein